MNSATTIISLNIDRRFTVILRRNQVDERRNNHDDKPHKRNCSLPLIANTDRGQYNGNIVGNHIRDDNVLLGGSRDEVHIVEIMKHPRICGNSQRPGCSLVPDFLRAFH